MKFKNKHFLGVVLTALMLLVALAGCSSGSVGYDGGYKGTLSESISSSNGYFGSNMSYDSAGTSSYNPNITTEDGMETKIIVNGDLEMETKNFDETVTSLEKLIKDCGGYIQSSHVYKAPDGVDTIGNKTAYYTVRVPANKYEEFIKGNEGIGNITDIRTSTEDITSTYYDTTVRISNLKAQEERVAEMYKQAKTISELIQIEDRLSSLRSQIEQLELKVRNWDVLTSYSTVDITVYEVKELTIRTTGFFDKLKESFIYSWKETFVGGLQSFILFVALNSSAIVVYGIIIYIAIRFIKKYEEKKAKKISDLLKTASKGNTAQKSTSTKEEPLKQDKEKDAK